LLDVDTERGLSFDDVKSDRSDSGKGKILMAFIDADIISSLIHTSLSSYVKRLALMRAERPSAV